MDGCYDHIRDKSKGPLCSDGTSPFPGCRPAPLLPGPSALWFIEAIDGGEGVYTVPRGIFPLWCPVLNVTESSKHLCFQAWEGIVSPTPQQPHLGLATGCFSATGEDRLPRAPSCGIHLNQAGQPQHQVNLNNLPFLE